MVKWHFKSFYELTIDELYEILCLRNEVFIVGQACAYQDCDRIDQKCYHLFGTIDGQIIAYTRLIPPGILYDVASFGRVVVSAEYRKKGFGVILVYLAMEALKTIFQSDKCKISAQLYLQEFYESFGFKVSSEGYVEDGIPHIKMMK